jgi:hypothetical protein
MSSKRGSASVSMTPSEHRCESRASSSARTGAPCGSSGSADTAGAQARQLSSSIIQSSTADSTWHPLVAPCAQHPMGRTAVIRCARSHLVPQGTAQMECSRRRASVPAAPRDPEQLVHFACSPPPLKRHLTARSPAPACSSPVPPAAGRTSALRVTAWIWHSSTDRYVPFTTLQWQPCSCSARGTGQHTPWCQAYLLISKLFVAKPSRMPWTPSAAGG